MAETNAAAPGIHAYIWRNSTVVYSLKNADQQTRKLFRQATTAFAKATHVRFIERTTEPLYIDVTSDHDGNVCGESPLGMLNAPQQLLLGRQCLDLKTAMHEIGHALGFGHEHQRADRDNYIEIDSSVRNSAAYRIDDTLTPEGAYDFQSIMHYADARIRRLDGQATLSGPTPSTADIEMIHRYYQKPVLDPNTDLKEEPVLSPASITLGPGGHQTVKLISNSLAEIVHYRLLQDNHPGLSVRDSRRRNGYLITVGTQSKLQQPYTIQIKLRHRSGTEQTVALSVSPSK